MAGVTAPALRTYGTTPDFVHDFLSDTWILVALCIIVPILVIGW